jgi:hypothetical protein
MTTLRREECAAASSKTLVPTCENTRYLIPEDSNLNIVTCIPIARQRLGKHSRKQTRNNYTSTVMQRISTYASLTTEAVFSAWSVYMVMRNCSVVEWVVKFGVGCWRELGLSCGDGSLRWLRRNGKKWIRLRKEDFMCHLKFSETVKNPLSGYDYWRLIILVHV